MKITSTFREYYLSFILPFFLISFVISAQVGIGTTDPKSTFEVNGSVGSKVNTVTANTTLDDTYHVILCNNAATAITITLPVATGILGRTYFIKREASSTANVTIAGTINGNANLVLKNANDAVTVISNGSEWKTLNNSNSTSAWSVNGNSGTTAGTNYIGTTDAKALSIKTNAIERVSVSSDGITKIGDIANTNDTKIEADGTLMLEGNATAWTDLMVYPDAVSKNGNNPPVYKKFTDNGSGTSTQGVWLWMFEPNKEEEVYFSVQMPHNYKVGSDLLPHVHWTTVSVAPTRTNVVWGLEYSVIQIGGTYPLTTITTGNSVIGDIATISGAKQHLITSLGNISGGTGINTIGISTILVCRLYRASLVSGDTFTSDVGLLGMDFHYEIDSMGSHTPFVK